MSVDDEVALIFTECLKHWTTDEAVALEGADPEGIHEMRVGLRRMRSALSDFPNDYSGCAIGVDEARNQMAVNEPRGCPRPGCVSCGVA
jgi:CHAD domain-containing protein